MSRFFRGTHTLPPRKQNQHLVLTFALLAPRQKRALHRKNRAVSTLLQVEKKDHGLDKVETHRNLSSMEDWELMKGRDVWPRPAPRHSLALALKNRVSLRKKRDELDLLVRRGGVGRRHGGSKFSRARFFRGVNLRHDDRFFRAGTRNLLVVQG